MKNHDIIEDMIKYYDCRAQWHDEYMSYTSLKDSLERHAPILDLIKSKIHNRDVLEIGCGTGNWTEILAQTASHVFAIDSSKSSLEIARKKLAAIKNLQLHQANIFEFSDFSHKYETLFAADFYSHVPLHAVPQLVESAKKLLKKNGTIIFVDMLCKIELQQEMIGQNNNGDLICQRVLPDGSEFKVIKNFPTEEQLISQLAGLGGQLKYFEFEYLQRWMVVCTMGDNTNND